MAAMDAALPPTCNCVFDEHWERVLFQCDYCFKQDWSHIRPARFDPEGKLVDEEACYGD